MFRPELRQIADALRTAELNAVPIARPGAFHGLSVDDAYGIQKINIDRRIAAGASVRGHKVGLTSKVMQAMAGVFEPDYGHLLDEMFVPSGSVVPRSKLCAPRVEIEIAFTIGEKLPVPGCTVDHVRRATLAVQPALELIDSRILDWDVGIVETVADNASSALVVLGSDFTNVAQLDLPALTGRLEFNDEVVDSGTGEAVLGDPAAAVAWLANKLHEFGVSIDEGDVVLSGSCTRAWDVKSGDRVRAEFDSIGDVTVSFG